MSESVISLGGAPSCSCDWLPVRTHQHQSVPELHSRFEAFPTEDGACLEAHFQGRQLRGQRTKLPEGYAGRLVRLDAGACDEGPKQWRAVAAFDTVGCWKHDDLPSRSDAQTRCMDWLNIATLVHAPIDLAEVECQLTKTRGAVTPL